MGIAAGALALALLALIVLLLLRSLPRVRALFAVPHLVEVAEQLARVRATALHAVIPPPPRWAITLAVPTPTPSPQNSFVSSAGLAVMYTIARLDDGRFEHHLSMSHQGRPFAAASATFFAAYVLHLLEVEHVPRQLAVSKKGIYHLIFHLSKSEHAAFADRVVAIPGESGMESIKEQCFQAQATFLSGLRASGAGG